MADGWSEIAQLLGLKQQRDEARRARITQPLGNIASMLYGSRQAGKQRDFLAGESDLERTGRLEEIGARGDIETEAATALFGREQDLATTRFGREQELSDTRFGREQELATTAFDRSKILEGIRFTNESVLNKQQKQFQLDTNQQIIDANIALQGVSDADARAREVDRFTNQLKLIQEEYTRTWGDFSTPLELADPTTGTVYEIGNPKDFDILIEKLRESSRLAALRLEAALRADPDDSAGKGQGLAIFEREFAKLQAAMPDVWADTQGWYVTVDQATYDTLSQMMNDNLTQLLRDGKIESIEDLGYIARLLDTYVKVPPEEEIIPPSARADKGGRVRSFVENMGGRDASLPGDPEVAPDDFGGTRVVNPEWAPLRREFLEEEASLGVEVAEREPWTALKSLLSGEQVFGEDRDEAVRLRRLLEEEGGLDAATLKSIADFLSLFGPFGNRPPTVPQQSPDNGTALIQQMLGRV